MGSTEDNASGGMGRAEDVPTGGRSDKTLVYVVCETDDIADARRFGASLESLGLTVMFPIEGESSEAARRDTAESMEICDGLIIYSGAGGDLWARAKLRFYRTIRTRRERDLLFLAIVNRYPRAEEDLGHNFPGTVSQNWVGNAEEVIEAIRTFLATESG